MESEDEEESGICITFDKSSSPADNMTRSSSLQALINSISSERERTKLDDGPVLCTISRFQFWTKLFQQSFLKDMVDNGGGGPKDDLLFYVRKKPITTNHVIRIKSEIEVYRRNNSKLPRLTDGTIDWEETVYLNLILQHFIYIVTVAVCTRTGPQEMQILKKFSQVVYASPSRRRMDSKGTEEEIVYPNIFFTLDNFEEVFNECIVRDSESICVELTAYDRCGYLQGVIFLGTIRYEALQRVYEARASLSSRFRMPSTWFQKTNRRVEFMRMRGPQSKGHAEMAVSRLENAAETPDAENFAFQDYDNEFSSLPRRRANSATNSPVRRPSDPHGTSWKMWRTPRMRKSRSDSENIDECSGIAEVDAYTVEEEFDDSRNPNNHFLGRSFGQAWYWFKERRRASSVALNAYLTYITLPWHRIIADVLEVRQQPILTFDLNAS